jgi:adenine-specific DNA-methyltransferase
MIYPRLKIARDLLSDDGVIFISIDHHEVLNLSKVSDEIFGLSNRIGIVSVINNLKGRSDDKYFATCNEFLLVYVKNRDAFNLGGFDLEEEELENDYDKQDEISYYKLIGFRKTGNAWKREERPFMFYPVLFKDNQFSTIDDEEFELIFDSKTNAFDDSYVVEITEKYKQLGYTVLWPQAEDGSLGRWRWGRKTFYEQKDFNLELNKAGTLCTKMRATLEDGSVRVKSAKTLWYKPEYDTGSSAKLLKALFGKD